MAQIMSVTDYIVTDSGNQIHRKSNIVAKNTISILGNSLISQDVELQGNIEHKISISIGKYCFLNKGAKIISSTKPVKLGNYNFIDSGTVVTSLSIGNRVLIGRDCRVDGIVGDSCILDHGVILSSNSVVPSYSYVTQDSNGKLIFTELEYSYKKIIETDVKKMFITGVPGVSMN